MGKEYTQEFLDKLEAFVEESSGEELVAFLKLRKESKNNYAILENYILNYEKYFKKE